MTGGTMTKVNWRLLGKSVWACAVGAITGTAIAIYPFSVTVQMGASSFKERLILALHSAMQANALAFTHHLCPYGGLGPAHPEAYSGCW